MKIGQGRNHIKYIPFDHSSCRHYWCRCHTPQDCQWQWSSVTWHFYSMTCLILRLQSSDHCPWTKWDPVSRKGWEIWMPLIMGKNGQNDALWEGYVAEIRRKSCIWYIQRKIYICGRSWAHMRVFLYKGVFQMSYGKTYSHFQETTGKFILCLCILMEFGVSENTLIQTKCETCSKCHLSDTSMYFIKFSNVFL